MTSRLFPKLAMAIILIASLLGILLSFQNFVLSLARAQLDPVMDYGHAAYAPFDLPTGLIITDIKSKVDAASFSAEKAEVYFEFSELFRGRLKFRKAILSAPKLKFSKSSSGILSAGFPMITPLIIIQKGELELIDQMNEFEDPLKIRLEKLEASIQEDEVSTTVHFRGSAEAELGRAAAVPVSFETEYAPAQDVLGLRIKLGKNGEIDFEGESVAFTSEMGFRGKLAIKKLKLEDWAGGQGPLLRGFSKGEVTAQFDVGGKGLYPDSLTRFLAVEGAIDVREGLLGEINFIRNILEQMTPVKGLENILKEPVPQEFQGLISQPDMPFNVMRVNISYSRGRFYAEEFVLQHPDFMIQADGSFSMVERDVDFRAKLVMMPRLSDYLTGHGKSLLLMQNKEGRLIVPFLYRGLMPGAMIYPDLSLLTNAVSAEPEPQPKKEYMRS